MSRKYVELVRGASSHKHFGAYLRNAGWEYNEYRGWIDIDYGDQVVYSKDDDEFSFYIMTDFPDCVAPNFDEFVERTEWYIRVSDKGYANAWNGLFWWEPIGYYTLDGAIDAAEKFINDFFAEYVQDKNAGKASHKKENCRRINMRKRAYNYWESMEFNGDEAVEFRDIIPINVYEGKSKYTDGGYVFDAMLYTDDVMWDEYDENESYTWGFLIMEDGSYEWGDYSGTFTGTEWEAQDWADGLIQKFIDDYEAGLITPQGMDYYS